MVGFFYGFEFKTIMSDPDERNNRMNNKGIGSGIEIIIILIIALLIAFLAMKNMGGLGNKPSQSENVVEQALDAVDAINDRIQQQYSAVEQP